MSHLPSPSSLESTLISDKKHPQNTDDRSLIEAHRSEFSKMNTDVEVMKDYLGKIDAAILRERVSMTYLLYLYIKVALMLFYKTYFLILCHVLYTLSPRL